MTEETQIHPSAIVDEGAKIGPGTKIWHWVHVSAGAVIGPDCTLGQNVYVGDRVVLGSNVKVQNNVSIYDNVTLEDDVFCGPSLVFTNVKNPRSHINRQDEFQDTVVRKGATLGANATIRCGVELGEYAFIGAGSVVLGDVPSYALMVGNPARQIGWICACGVRLQEHTSMTCEACGAGYLLKYDRVEAVS